jgi:hypothetical protein
VERRKSNRHEIVGRVVFQWKEGNRVVRENLGILRNVSRRGLFVETDNAPPLGTEISIQCQLLRARKVPLVLIRTKGRISRIEFRRRSKRVAGIAISTASIQLQKLQLVAGQKVISLDRAVQAKRELR